MARLRTLANCKGEEGMGHEPWGGRVAYEEWQRHLVEEQDPVQPDLYLGVAPASF